jgi:hypothetical protein
MLGIAPLGQLAFAQLPLGLTAKPRDTHFGSDDYYRRRHAPVYSEEYYDALRPRLEAPEAFYEKPVPLPVPNLRISISRLIPGVALPSLMQLPPYRPMPSLTTNPPEFRMATPSEIADDDEMIIRLLLEE